MKGKREKILVPALRFSEFKKEREWDFVSGNSLFVPVVNKNHNSDLPILAITQDRGAVPRELIDYKVIVSDNSIKNYKIVEIGDFIISLRSFQGGIEYSNYKGLCSPAYIVLRKNSDAVNNDFYRHYLKSANYILELNKNIEGIRDGKMVSYQQFSSIKYPFPSPNEQQKIAECLSSIDEEINAMKEKVGHLKTHKKGLMQKLFPVAGKFVPEVRFPKFVNEWGKDILKVLVKKITPLKKMQTAEYHKKGIFPIIDQSQSFICGFSDDKSALINEKKEDVVIFGDHTCILKLVNFPFIQGADGIKIFKSLNPNTIRTDYIYQYLNAFPIRMKEYKRHYSELKEIIVCYSDCIIEQQKIAECFSSIDELIGLYESKVALLEQHKKGLMQQLFPKI